MGDKQRIIGFVGAPSTGKTTLARAVANAAGLRGLSVEFVAEYARNYLQRFGSIDEQWEQLLIFDTQARREDDAIRAGADLVIAETPAFTGYAYGSIGAYSPSAAFAYGSKRATDGAKCRKVMHTLHRWMTERLPLYSQIYYIPPEIGMQMDGVRQESEAMRLRLDRVLRATLDLWVPTYITVKGTVEDRMDTVLKAEFGKET